MPTCETIDISIVVPMHNEEGNVQQLWKEVDAIIPKLDGLVELVLVDDGSTDNTLKILEELASQDHRLKVVELEGNWGQAGAFCAGFEVADGEVVLTMDGDLQNDPADFPKALAKINEGYKVVTGWRKDRKERYWDRVLPSKCANLLISLATGLRAHDNGCGLKAYRAEVVKSVYLPKGFNRFMPAIFGVRNGEVAEITANDRKRFAGETHYGLKRTFVVFKDLMSIHAVLNFPKRKLFFYRALFGVSLVGMVFLMIWAVVMGPRLLLITLLPLALLAMASRLIVSNLRRFLMTQKSKGFKIRRVIHGGGDTHPLNTH